MKKEFDSDLIELIFLAFKGLEILPNVKILGYEWVPDESKYDANNHIVRRNSNKNKIIKSMNETRCGIMYIDISVTGMDKSGMEKIYYIKKPLIVPIKDKDGYYLIKGKKCYLIYQLVDKMLYPYFSAISIKSLMPINIKMSKETIVDINGEIFTSPVYTIQIFKNAINVLLYSHLGISSTLIFLEVNKFIRVLCKDDYEKRDGYLYFECNKDSNIVIEVLADIFDKEIYVKSITACLVKLFTDLSYQYDDVDNVEKWLTIVGGKDTVRRGMYQHIFFKRLLDDVTRRELKINDYDKQNIYYLLKWALQNFHALWAKDNLSMDHKRLRCNEYIAGFITAEISKKINRLVSLGDKATIKDYLNIFKFPENILIIKLHGSGVLRYSEINSDMDFELFFHITKKGPNSLGNRDDRRIPIRQRSLHPSMMGRLDLAECSSSDPGMGGSLSPYTRMDSLYFDNSNYENELHFRLADYIKQMELDDDAESLYINCKTEEDYNKALDTISKATEERIKVYGTSRNPLEIIVEKDPRDNYRVFDEKFLMKEEDK